MRYALVVEDDLVQALFVEMKLRQMGYETSVAHSCAIARKHLKHGFDLVWIDVHLPDGSGVDLAREFSNTIKTRQTDVVVSSFDDSVGTTNAAHETSNAIMFVSKPIDWSSVHKTLKMVQAARSEAANGVAVEQSWPDLRFGAGAVRLGA